MSLGDKYAYIDTDLVSNITPELLALLFSEMDSSEQAAFFNHIAEISTPWLYMQLQYITDDDGLTLAGRRVMQYIGDYSHWGLVPQADMSFLEKA